MATGGADQCQLVGMQLPTGRANWGGMPDGGADYAPACVTQHDIGLQAKHA